MSELKQQRRRLREENAKWPPHPVSVPAELWPNTFTEIERVAVWRSKHFVIQLFAEVDGAQRLTISRPEMKGDGTWRDDISWDELQRIKSQIGLGDRDAVEIYPADQDVVNVANMRHLWLVKEPLPFQWRRKRA